MSEEKPTTGFPQIGYYCSTYGLLIPVNNAGCLEGKINHDCSCGASIIHFVVKDGDNYKGVYKNPDPNFTPKKICPGHEFTHGNTKKNVNFVYDDNSGNCSVCKKSLDIFNSNIIGDEYSGCTYIGGTIPQGTPLSERPLNAKAPVFTPLSYATSSSYGEEKLDFLTNSANFNVEINILDDSKFKELAIGNIKQYYKCKGINILNAEDGPEMNTDRYRQIRNIYKLHTKKNFYEGIILKIIFKIILSRSIFTDDMNNINGNRLKLNIINYDERKNDDFIRSIQKKNISPFLMVKHFLLEKVPHKSNPFSFSFKENTVYVSKLNTFVYVCCCLLNLLSEDNFNILKKIITNNVDSLENFFGNAYYKIIPYSCTLQYIVKESLNEDIYLVNIDSKFYFMVNPFKNMVVKSTKKTLRHFLSFIYHKLNIQNKNDAFISNNLDISFFNTLWNDFTLKKFMESDIVYGFSKDKDQSAKFMKASECDLTSLNTTTLNIFYIIFGFFFKMYILNSALSSGRSLNQFENTVIECTGLTPDPDICAYNIYFGAISRLNLDLTINDHDSIVPTKITNENKFLEGAILNRLPNKI